MIRTYLINKKNNLFQTVYKFINNNYNKKDISKVTLGRWGLEECDNKINIKVDNANEDHCGTCAYTKKN
jgi:hypothetical protein